MKKTEKICWIIPLVMWIIIMFSIVPYGDDLIFQQEFSNMSLLEYINLRWNTWSSRIIIDVLARYLTSYNKLFIILTIVLLLALFKALCLIQNEYGCNNRWIVTCLCLCFPLYLYKWAWIVDSLNYLYPLVFLVINIVILNKTIKNTKISTNFYILSLILQIYMTNQEQAWGVWTTILVSSIVYCIYKKEKVPLFIYVCMFLIFCMFIVHIFCPGVALRKSAQIDILPEFVEWNLFDKLLIANIHMYKHFICMPQATVLVLTIILFVSIWGIEKNRNLKFYKITHLCSAYSTILVLSFYCNTIWDISTIPFGKFISKLLFIPDNIHFLSSNEIFPLFLWGMYILSILIQISSLCTDLKEFWILFTFLASGYVSMLIMGFTPTIYASDIRTLSFMHISFILVDLILMCKLYKDPDIINNFKVSAFTIIGLISSYMFFFQCNYSISFIISTINWIKNNS